MRIFQKYIKRANLDNKTARPYQPERETGMPINKKKIRREVVLNGARVWITANTEQEYAEKLTNYASVSYDGVREKHNFADYANRWFQVFSDPNIERVTSTTYRRQLDLHIFPVIGHLNIEDVSVSDVQTIFNRLGENASQETKNKVKTVLNQIFKMAVEDRLIGFNPLQSTTLKLKGHSSTAVEPYSVTEMRYFVSHLCDIVNDEDRAWFALSISLPLRPEEVLGVRWENVEGNILHVRNTVTHPARNDAEFKEYTKTDASRRDLVIPDWVLPFLGERGRPSDFVVGGCLPATYMKIRRMRERIAKQINYDGSITPRRFRTTVATDISDMTHDLKLVQKMLGHATPQMTLKHYDKGRSTAVDACAAISKCYGF